jgi:hypothetical protein
VTKLATKPAEGDTLAFWQAYLELERLKHRNYQPIANKYELRVSDSVVALKTQSAQIASWMFPDELLGLVTDATIEYVEELRTLRDLSPEEDRAFFDYGIAQEQAQAEALQHARDGRFDVDSTYGATRNAGSD